MADKEKGIIGPVSVSADMKKSLSVYHCFSILRIVIYDSFKSNAFAEISGPNKLSQKKFKLILVWRPNVLVLSPVFIGMNIAPKHCNFYAVVHWKVRKGIQKISPNRDMQDPNKFALCKSWLALLFEKIALIQVSHYTNPDSTRTYMYKKTVNTVKYRTKVM